jgi:hypothetical protein
MTASTMHVAEWERRSDESAVAFSWFARYRSLLPTERSIARLVSDADTPGKQATLKRRIERWSARYEWRRRVESSRGTVR